MNAMDDLFNALGNLGQAMDAQQMMLMQNAQSQMAMNNLQNLLGQGGGLGYTPYRVSAPAHVRQRCSYCGLKTAPELRRCDGCGAPL